MADDHVRGRFVWHELMTPNSVGAHAFYSTVLGWTSEPWEQDPSYSMFAASRGPVGGSVESREGAPYWVPYIGVPDVDAATRQATELGGDVRTEPTAMPNGGRHAMLLDPQGALFGIYSSPADPGPETDPALGEFSWHELATTDNLAAFDFYSTLFGWDKVEEVDMGPAGVYLIFGRNGRRAGGIFNRGEGEPGAAYWLPYVRVGDVDETVGKVQAERGSLVNGPMEVPGGDRVAQLMDPHGALFAVHALAADVKAAAKPAAAKAAAEKPRTDEAPAASAAAGREERTAAGKVAGKTPADGKTARKKAGGSNAARQEAAPKRAAPKKAAKKTAKKKTAKKKAAKKKAASKKALPKKAAKKKPAKKTTARKAAAKKATKKKAAKKVARKKAVKKKATGKKAAKSKPVKARATKTKSKKTKSSKTGASKSRTKKKSAKAASRKAATKPSTGSSSKPRKKKAARTRRSGKGR